MKSGKTYALLAFAGAMPFMACAALLLLGVDTLAPLGSVAALAGSYGLVIACFLAGTHWAIYLLKQDTIRLNLFVVSNIVLLALWVSYIVADLSVALVTQICAFAYLLYVDFYLLKLGITQTAYFRVRVLATTFACGSLLIVAVAH